MSEEKQSKGIFRSSINIASLVVVLCSAVTDPMFKAYFGDFIPTEWMMRIAFIAGWLIIYFRSNSNPNIPLDWRNPWKDVKN